MNNITSLRCYLFTNTINTNSSACYLFTKDDTIGLESKKGSLTDNSLYPGVDNESLRRISIII